MKREVRSTLLQRVMTLLLVLTLAMTLSSSFSNAEATGESQTRWGSAADEIDKYLDTAFEHYLAGDAKAAYNCVNDAYFKVYEVTGFERQTMSYVSGPRKNAVELQYSTCKAAVKKDNQDPEIKSAPRGMRLMRIGRCKLKLARISAHENMSETFFRV